MDFMRSARPTFFQQFKAPAPPQQGAFWYATAPGAKVFPGWSSFASYNYQELGASCGEHSELLCDRERWPFWGFSEDGTPESGIGECRQEGAPWSNGDNWLFRDGQHFCGTLAQYESGVDPSKDPTWITDEFGGGACCPSPPLWMTAGAFQVDVSVRVFVQVNLVQHVTPMLAGCQLFLSSSLQSIPSSTPTALQWGPAPRPQGIGIGWDTGAGSDFSFYNAGDDTLVNAPYDGIYLCTYGVQWNLIPDPGSFSFNVKLDRSDGATFNDITVTRNSGAVSSAYQWTREVKLLAGQGVRVSVEHFHGSGINDVIGFDQTFISLRMIAPLDARAGPTGVCATVVQIGALGPVLEQPCEHNYNECFCPTFASADLPTATSPASSIGELSSISLVTGSSLSSEVSYGTAAHLSTGSSLAVSVGTDVSAALSTGSEADLPSSYTPGAPPVPGTTCASAGSWPLGATYTFTLPTGGSAQHWFTFMGTAGTTYHIRKTTNSGPAISASLWAGSSCASQILKVGLVQTPDPACGDVASTTQQWWIKVTHNPGGATSYTLDVGAGPC